MQSERLLMIPFTAQIVRLALNDQVQLQRELHVQLAEGWPGEDFAAVLPWMLNDMQNDPAREGWDGMIMLRTSRVVIGSMGLKGGPDAQGVADLGYNILPPYQRQGYATEMARALITWAFEQKDLKKVTADCLIDNMASIRVLEKAGLRHLGVSGDLLQWAITRDEWCKTYFSE